MKKEMNYKDVLFIIISISLLSLSLASGIQIIQYNEQQKRIKDLEQQVELLQEDNQFLKDHYEEEIVMLDSQLLVLEADIVEMKDGVELIKK